MTPPRNSAALGAGLPAFDRPPVVEVASSIQFGSIEGLNTARLGLLWGRYRDRYPRTEIHPPLGSVIESFGAPASPNISFTFEGAVMPLRFWFLAEEGTRLLQVQRDRFALNWRKLESEEKYPHYSELSGMLIQEFELFESFLQDERLTSPQINQVELTYVNHLPAGAPRTSRQPVEHMVRLWAGSFPQLGLPDPELVSFASSHVMGGPERPIGRLHINLDSRYRANDNAPVYALQLMARSVPDGPGLAGAITAMDRCHRWIVQNFAAITTPEMHRMWERTDDQRS